MFYDLKPCTKELILIILMFIIGTIGVVIFAVLINKNLIGALVSIGITIIICGSILLVLPDIKNSCASQQYDDIAEAITKADKIRI